MMIKRGQIKMIFRGWARNPLNTAISLASLTVGLACSVVLILFVMNEYKIAVAYTHSDNTYLLQTVDSRNEALYGTQTRTFVGSDFPTPLQNSFPGIESFCIVCSMQSARIVIDGQEEGLWGFYEAFPSFADYFDVPVVAGDLKRTLSSPNEIAVSQSYASAHFGTENPIGKAVTVIQRKYDAENGWKEVNIETIRYITTVVDDSKKGLLQFQAMTALPESRLGERGWIGLNLALLELSEGTDRAEFERKVNADSSFLAAHRVEKIRLTPLDRIYFAASEGQALFASRDPMLLYIGSFTSLLILLIACFNYINLALTNADSRLRNMAGQRIMGASRGSVRWQLFVETLLQVGVCFVLALGLIGYLLPVFNSYLQSDVDISELFASDTLALVVLLLLLVALLPSLYILARLETDSLLVFVKKAGRRGPRLSQGMIVAQFAISTALIIVSLNIYRQIRYISEIRPCSDDILIVSVPPIEGMAPGQAKKEFEDRVRRLASVEGVKGGVPDAMMWYPYQIGTESVMVASTQTEPGYFDFYGVRLLDGRDFRKGDDPQKVIVVNRAMARLLDLSDPVGHTMELNDQTYTIIGLCPDIPTKNMHVEVAPCVYNLSWGNDLDFYTFVKAYPGQGDAVRESVTKILREMSEESFAFIFTLAEWMRNQHVKEVRLSKMVLTFTVVSLSLTLMGLFGLSWYSVERRRREIALRKVNGATTGEVVRMLCAGFLRWILLAVAIALPFSYYFSQLWLNDFVYKVDMGFVVFVLATLIVVLTGIGTVVYQSFRAARRNPVVSIKTE